MEETKQEGTILSARGERVRFVSKSPGRTFTVHYGLKLTKLSFNLHVATY